MKYISRTKNESPVDNELAEKHRISRIAAQIIANRGLNDDCLEEFLHPDFNRLLSPFEFDAMGEVCERIEAAIAQREQIAVYSDYDTDGICAAAIMYHCLSKLGAKPIMYVPDRFTEGYGTNPDAIKGLCKEASLIITVDCGIRSVSDVELARSMGVDVIIADHHECGELPKTPYILNPKRPNENYPFKELCGAGIAFKLAFALLEEEAFALADIAAVATIADMVPLVGENRIIASCGISKINQDPNRGIKALAEAASYDYKKIKSADIGFGLSPRINAAGRMASGRIALDMLLADNDEEAKLKAEQLCRLNSQRQAMQKSVISKCMEQAELQNLSKTKIIIVKAPEFDEGVVGLAASGIANKYNRPAVVFKQKDGILTGSARSIEGIDIYAVLNSCSDLFIKFGGHEQAAGLTMDEANFDELIRRASLYIEKNYENEVFVRKIIFDAKINPDDVTLEDVEGLSVLEPFGIGNEKPEFLMMGAKISAIRRIGQDGAHAKMKANGKLDLVYFSAPKLAEDTSADIAGELSINEFNSNKSVQMIVDSFSVKTSPQNIDKKDFVRGFPSQIRALNAILSAPEKYELFKSVDKWREALLKSTSDPIGTVVCVNSLIGLSAFNAMQISDMEVYYGYMPKFTSENAVIIAADNEKAVKNFCNIFTCGDMTTAANASGAKILLNSGMYKAYLSKAKQYYVDENELDRYYGWFCKAPAGESISEIIENMLYKSKVDSNFYKLWYALNVFIEQKLIVAKKSDKIILKPNNKAERESKTKAAFDELLS